MWLTLLAAELWQRRRRHIPWVDLRIRRKMSHADLMHRRDRWRRDRRRRADVRLGSVEKLLHLLLSLLLLLNHLHLHLLLSCFCRLELRLLRRK